MVKCDEKIILYFSRSVGNRREKNPKGNILPILRISSINQKIKCAKRLRTDKISALQSVPKTKTNCQGATSICWKTAHSTVNHTRSLYRQGQILVMDVADVKSAIGDLITLPKRIIIIWCAGMQFFPRPFGRITHLTSHNTVSSRYVESLLHSLGNYTRRAIFPEMCKINQSIKRSPFAWLLDWR